MTQTPKRFKTGSSVMMPAGVIQEISDIQYVHNRYQLKGISGWRYGIDQLRRVDWKSEALKWREEALRQYPTPEAYEAVCAARDKYQVRADIVDKTIRELVEIIEYEADLADLRGAEMHARELRAMVATLYPDTPAPTPEIKQPVTARPIDEWHEDHGDVLWWMFPIQEPPYCGTPLDSSWSDDYTHWTPFLCPDTPAPKEGDSK